MIFRLFVASVKMMFRDIQTLFWGLAFPAMFVVIFGLFSFGGGAGSASMAIIDQANTPESQQFIASLRQIQFFKFKDQIHDVEAAQSAIQDGDLNAAIVIPPSFTFANAGNPGAGSIELTVFYDKTNVVEYQLVKSVLNQIFSEINISLTGVPRLFSLREEALDSKNIKYMDFLLPGIMGMGLMMNGIVGIAVDLTRFREQRILKRIRVTPLPPRNFIISQVFAYLVLVAIQATIIILVAVLLFNATIYGNLLNLYLVALLGTLIFLNIGFIVAGMSRTPTGASSLAQVISMPMMFLSGTFFSTESLPGIISSVVQYFPLTPLLNALRGISLADAPLTSLGSELLLLGIWLGITFLLAARVFKFRAE